MMQDVEHELTEKVEVLVYCPLTIRQRLLYKGLRQNIRMEELLAGTVIHTAYQCCGSGSEIRCLFDPWIRDPGWVKFQDPDPVLTTHFRELRKNFLG